MGRADVHVRLGRHAHVADGMRADEAGQLVLAGNRVGVAQVLDQFERVPDREDLGALDVFDVVGERRRSPS